MANLKIEFQKPKLTLCNTNYTPLGILTNKTSTSAHNITLTSKVNETPYLTFDIPLGGLIDNNSTELLVKHKNDYFVIKDIQLASGDSNSMVVTAEHIACELKGIVVSYFEDLIGETPENMWNTVVANSTMPEVISSRYIFETNIVNTYRYLSGEDEKSVFEHLVDIAEQFEACLLFSTDANGIIHIKLLYGDINRGKFVRKGKDLKQLSLMFNTESLFTKITPFGATDDDGIELTIMDLNNGKSYLTNYDYYLAKGMTMEEILANPLCNQECIYRNTDIVDAEDLLRLGQQELKRLSEPIVSGSIEIIDLGVFEDGLYLSPILCEKIMVIDKDINYSISCKITEIEFTYDNPLESKISISNVVKYNSALKDMIKNNDALGEILTNGLNGRPNLNASKVKGLIDGHIAQLKYSMENSITDITDAVILFENRIEGSDMFGALALGSRGILISRELDIVTNQWVWTTALDSHGLSTQVVNAIEINASQIKGDILSSYDNSTWINLNNGEFNFKDKIKFVDNEFRIALNSGGTIEDFVAQYEKDKQNMTNDINDVAQEVTNIKSNIDVVISDGIVTEAEVASIEKSIMQLQKEKVDIDTRYTSMVNNSYLDSELKSELTSSYNNYTKAHRDFVGFIQNIITDRKITERERADLDTYSSSYNTALATLKTNMDTCLSNIAENNTAYQINNLKTQIDSDFKDVNDRLNTIMDDVGGAVADGIIEEAEVLIIQNSINQLNKEKEDVDMIYNTLYNNNDVPTDIKRNLKTKYDEYVAIHRNLITFINNMVSDKVATESEKATFNNLSSSYSTKLAEFKNSANLALVMANKNYTDTQFNVLDGKIEMRVTSTEVNELVNSNLEESKAYSDTLFQECQNQIDGVVETYYQSTDPSLDWTTAELKAKHIGDIWYNTLDKSTYIYVEASISSDGTMGTAWQKLTDAEAEQAYVLASSKAKVFTSTPTTPYKKGDLWVQGSSGDIMKCIYTRTSGNYSSSDWAKASKYTDDTVANNVASDLANNYYTITETDSAIKVASDNITATVSETYTTKNELGNTLSNYTTKSELTQTSKDITAKFTSGGGQNLLKNSDAKNGAYMWSGNGATLTIGTSGANPFFGGNEFKSTFPNGLRYSESIKLKANTDYVYEGWIFCHASFSGHGAMPLHYWCMNTPDTPGQSQLEVLDYRQNVTANVFNKCYVHFRTKSGDVYFTPFVYGGPDGQMVAVRQLSLTEGRAETAWTPHPSEIYEGSTVIDASGVTVNNGALRVKDSSGNIMLEGDTSGTLYLRKQLKVGTIGTFSPSGVTISGGNFTVSGGTAYKEASIGYSDGSTTSQSLYSNGLYGSSSETNGSQLFVADSFYGSNGWTIHEDNSGNSLQQSYRTYSRGSGIYIQATNTDKFGNGSFKEVARLNHEGLTCNTITVKSNGACNNILAGDDAYIGDVNKSHSIGIQSSTDRAKGIIYLGNRMDVFVGCDDGGGRLTLSSRWMDFIAPQAANFMGNVVCRDGAEAGVTGFEAYRGGGHFRIAPSNNNGAIAFEQFNSSGTAVGMRLIADGWYLRPNGNDGGILGYSSIRWQEIWCTRGAFNGSDSKLKENITPLDNITPLGIGEFARLRNDDIVTPNDLYNYVKESQSYTFNYKGTSETMLGILADDIPRNIFNKIGVMSKTQEEYEEELKKKEELTEILSRIPMPLDIESEADSCAIVEGTGLTYEALKEEVNKEIEEPMQLINAPSQIAMLQTVLSMAINKIDMLEQENQELKDRLSLIEEKLGI